MEFLSEIGIFAAKTIIILLSAGGLILLTILLTVRGRVHDALEIQNMNEFYDQLKELVLLQTLDKKALKTHHKQHKKQLKDAQDKTKQKLYVLTFDGDIQADQVQRMREEISIIINVAQPEDEVVLKLNSPGGLVTPYGLAASQLERLKEKKLKLTVCVDEVAASGGYLMACVANQIIAAPFAIVGSIGVLASFPNFHRLLTKHDIEYQEVTAGEYKRTISTLGELTPQGMQKFRSQIEDTHLLFKNFVFKHRPQIALEKVATGEYWYGIQALDLHLIDRIQTSDDYILERCHSHDIFKINYMTRKKWREKLSESISHTLETTLNSTLQKLSRLLFFHSKG